MKQRSVVIRAPACPCAHEGFPRRLSGYPAGRDADRCDRGPDRDGADVAVRIGALTDSTLVARKLAPHRRIVVASPDYLAGRSPPRCPEELRDHHCLLFALQPSGGWHYRPLEQQTYLRSLDIRFAGGTHSLKTAA